MRKKIVSIQLLIIYILSIFIMSFSNISVAEDTSNVGKNGYISSIALLQTITGTGPFDSNDEPGNDSSETNDIVRSFDQVTYTVEATMRLKPSSGSTGIKGGRIRFEAVLPEADKNIAVWDKEAMTWAEDIKISQDKKTITGYYKLDEKELTIPGKQTLNFIVKVLGAPNGLEFKPTFKTWLEGNEENEKVSVQGAKVKVSAAPKYNLRLLKNPYLNNKVTINHNGADIRGRIYAYSVGIQLYNDSSSKGLKGIEYPTRRYYF